ncbi:hypothetical protein ACWCQZ_47330, partial [Streptomyces sp. NPDC002285]
MIADRAHGCLNTCPDRPPTAARTVAEHSPHRQSDQHRAATDSAFVEQIEGLTVRYQRRSPLL